MEDNKIFIEWLKNEINEVKMDIRFLRTDSIRHIHERIDELHERIDKIYKELNSNLKGKHIYYLFVILILGLIGIEGIKGIVPLIFKMLQ
ncbi:MAG: hypothetical protein AB1567_12365 [bacterium]